MIKVENVSFKYKNSDKKIVDNLNFEVKDGEIIAIVGQNGSGKSTIGKLISGIIKLKQGNITVDDLIIEPQKCLLETIVVKPKFDLSKHNVVIKYDDILDIKDYLVLKYNFEKVLSLFED